MWHRESMPMNYKGFRRLPLLGDVQPKSDVDHLQIVQKWDFEEQMTRHIELAYPSRSTLLKCLSERQAIVCNSSKKCGSRVKFEKVRWIVEDLHNTGAGATSLPYFSCWQMSKSWKFTTTLSLIQCNWMEYLQLALSINIWWIQIPSSCIGRYHRYSGNSCPTFGENHLI